MSMDNHQLSIFEDALSVDLDVEAPFLPIDRLAIEFEVLAPSSRVFHSFLQFSRNVFLCALAHNAHDVFEGITIPTSAGDDGLGIGISRAFKGAIAKAAQDRFGIIHDDYLRFYSPDGLSRTPCPIEAQDVVLCEHITSGYSIESST